MKEKIIKNKSFQLAIDIVRLYKKLLDDKEYD